MEQLTAELQESVRLQMEENVTTFLEVVLNQELGEPFRRDAMKKPVSVAGIDPADSATSRFWLEPLLSNMLRCRP